MSEWRDGYQALGTKPRERDNLLGDLFLLFLKLLKWTVIVCGAAFGPFYGTGHYGGIGLGTVVVILLILVLLGRL
jgi:hypothetical protein